MVVEGVVEGGIEAGAGGGLPMGVEVNHGDYNRYNRYSYNRYQVLMKNYTASSLSSLKDHQARALDSSPHSL